MENDTGLNGRSLYTRIMQQYVMGLHSSSYTHRANDLHYNRQDGREAVETLEIALKATRLMLEENPAGNRHVTINPSGDKKSRRSLHFVLNVLKANFRPGPRQELIGDHMDATYEILVR